MAACQVGSELRPAEGLPPTAAISGDSLGVTLNALAPCLCHMNVFSGPHARLPPLRRTQPFSRSWRAPPPPVMAEALLVREGHTAEERLGAEPVGGVVSAPGPQPALWEAEPSSVPNPSTDQTGEGSWPSLCLFSVLGVRLEVGAPVPWAGGRLACRSPTSLLAPRLGVSPLLFGFPPFSF